MSEKPPQPLYQNLPIDILQISQNKPVIRTETDANGYKTNYYSDGTSIRYDPSGTACAAFNANGELIYTPQDTNTNTNQSQDTSNQTNNSDSGQSTNESE